MKKKPKIKIDKKRLAEIEKWSNQDVIIKCKMHQAGDLMDLLYMADGGPFNDYFRSTIKLNHIEEAYAYWLDKMTRVVCPEIYEEEEKLNKHRRQNGKGTKRIKKLNH